MKTSSLTEQHALIVVIDGVCVVCSNLARFVVHFNPEARLMWAQNPKTVEFLSSQGISFPDIMSSIAVFSNKQIYRGSDAFAVILRSMPWYLAVVGWLMILFPRVLREFVYSLIARNRYRIFGKTQSCSIADKTLRSKFLHPV